MDVGYKLSLKNAQTNEELERYFFRQLKKTIRVQLPVKIIEVDHAKQHCDVQVLLKELDDTGQVLPPDIIPNVPIRYTNETGVAYVRTPIQIGDTGTVEFFDCSVARWKVEGIVEYHFNENYHTLESSVYTSGFVAEKDVFEIADVENTAIEIGTKAGTFIFNVDKTTGALTITAPSIVINSPINTINGNLTVTGTIGGNAITSATTIASIGNISTSGNIISADAVVNGKNVDGHTHGGVQAGNGTTGAF